MLGQQVMIVLLGFVDRLCLRRPVIKVDLLSFLDAKVL
jgi:hypothetical protein